MNAGNQMSTTQAVPGAVHRERRSLFIATIALSATGKARRSLQTVRSRRGRCKASFFSASPQAAVRRRISMRGQCNALPCAGKGWPRMHCMAVSQAASWQMVMKRRREQLIGRRFQYIEISEISDRAQRTEH